MRHDLRDALDGVRPEPVQAPNAADEQQHAAMRSIFVCSSCKSHTAPGTKLRYCGRCESETYCSKQCAEAHWVEHKLVCETFRGAHDKALEAHAARGGRKQDYNQMNRDLIFWFSKVPGLINEMQLLAWKHRSEKPFISAETFQNDVDGSEIRVEVTPRRIWEEDPSICSSDVRAWLQQNFGGSSFGPTQDYCFVFTMSQRNLTSHSTLVTYPFDRRIVHGAEIVEALTVATRAGDIANAFAWIVSSFSSHTAQKTLQVIRSRAILHGSTTLAGSLPVPSRAINNEVAYMMMDLLRLEFHVRLTGLRGAAHLNGREGVIRGEDPGNNERWKARLDDRTYVSVRAVNFVHIRRGEYKRRLS